jgi:hypothetical protein
LRAFLPQTACFAGVISDKRAEKRFSAQDNLGHLGHRLAVVFVELPKLDSRAARRLRMSKNAFKEHAAPYIPRRCGKWRRRRSASAVFSGSGSRMVQKRSKSPRIETKSRFKKSTFPAPQRRRMIRQCRLISL